MEATSALLTLAGGLGVMGLSHTAWRRLQLSFAKHPSLTGHSKMAKRLAKWLPGYAYDEAQFFGVDGVSPAQIQRRKLGFQNLCKHFAQACPQSIALTQHTKVGLTDLQFTSAYRVPFQFSPYLTTHLALGAFMQRAEGVELEDLDGNQFIDLSGSYGVNVLGVEVYKQCIDQAVKAARDLGPVLGALHPVVASNVDRLKRISGMDEVSFHMSGTEAVMQAVRLARYHTGKTHLVRFCGAYHGWWEDVQPGPGNPLPPRETYTLRDQDERSLQVLRTRKDIACVLVNPLQSLHPNSAAPADSGLIGSGRKAAYDRAAYAQWLQSLRQVCTERGIVLIFDEVFLGFRLAIGGAQAYFGVQADMVTYGKTLGGGLPVGVVCGRSKWMKRFRTTRPADICFARGTFNAHPYVMTAMSAFLDRLETIEVKALYDEASHRWTQVFDDWNRKLNQAGMPVKIVHMETVATILYTRESRYNWMLQFYLRRHGLALSWVGSGRMIFSLNFSDEDVEEVQRRFEAACRDMSNDGWWSEQCHQSAKQIQRSVLLELLRAKFKA